MKRSIVVLWILVLIALVGCVQQPGGATAPAAGGSASTGGGRVVYLINGALGDNAFYDSGQMGIDQLAEEYGVETRTIETNFDAGQYEPALEAAVAYADVIFVISYGFEDQLKEIADQNPDKIFVNIDTVVENEADTITSVDFIEEESAYLTGVVAGMTTLDTSIPGINEAKIIGAVGGDVDPVINAFIFAYTNGAQSVDPEIQVESTFLGSWDDTAKGKQAALQLYDQGSDINFQIAAAAGLGVLQAAAERDLYAIGVDTNQNDLEPGHVVASDLKDVGRAITDVYATIVDGTYEAGQVLEYGLASGAVDVTFEAQEQVLPQSIIDHVDEVRQQIVSGALTVERYTGE
ncbi:MAG TPA: BMP family ABC transporter substrate-binding protein [Caldilineaceae bacterium]|nr:BMP family ABC transporter substrate-binding protein [Caldilineaceae bacterium]